MEILVLKTAALGDVLRTTSILPGLAARHPGGRVTWMVKDAGLDLVRNHPLVARAAGVDPEDPGSLARIRDELSAVPWGRVFSLDEDEPLLRMATEIAGRGEDGVLSGGFLGPDGRPAYTTDTAPWFDMGLISVHGRAEADRRKLRNVESHAAIHARMLGIEMGEPQLPLPAAVREFAAGFAARTGLDEHGAVIGVNTGAGRRWRSKRLPRDRTAALIVELHRRMEGAVTFLLFGGPREAERNDAIRAAVPADVRLIDSGPGNTLVEFAALVAGVDVLVTSDSLALHVGVAHGVPLVVFFAPTSAAEVELYGRGEKIVSTAPDACSYRSDADTSTLTVERLADATLRVLAAHPPEWA